MPAAADPASAVVQTAYVVGRDEQLVYQPTGGPPQALPLTGVRRVRFAARDGTIAVAASTARTRKVFVRVPADAAPSAGVA